MLVESHKVDMCNIWICAMSDEKLNMLKKSTVTTD